MLNQCVLVGRLVEEPTTIELENNIKVSYIKIAVSRSFKNANGEYDTDIITCKLLSTIACSTNEYCHKGDILGVKGRIQVEEVDGTPVTQVIAEKVTFLNSKKEEEA